MKIYGQNFSDIFKKLPWAYQAVVVLSALFLTYAAIAVPVQIHSRFEAMKEKPAPLKITSGGRTPKNILDPSLAFDPATKTRWLAYTAETQTEEKEKLFQVRLAYSNNPDCNAWYQKGEEGFNARADDLIAPDGQSVFRKGKWRVETPSLLHTPGDKGREWKLFAYKYFWPDNDPVYSVKIAQRYAMIVYRFASSPEGPWSDEIALFSAAPDWPPPPYEKMVLLHLSRLHAYLSAYKTFARPSAVFKDGAMYLLLSAFEDGETSPKDAVLLVSRDFGGSWLYVGKMGLEEPFTAATMIDDGVKAHLAVAGNAGTRVFEFLDLATAKISNTARKIPLSGKFSAGGGAVGYTAACPFGFLSSEYTGKEFLIYKTFQHPSLKER